MLNTIIKYVLRRLTEGSTIRNLVLFICSISGLTLSEQQTNSVIFIVLGLIGFLGVALPDNMYDLKRDLDKDAKDIDGDDDLADRVSTDTNALPSSASDRLGTTSSKDIEDFTTHGFNDR